jgi:hypothetical protein
MLMQDSARSLDRGSRSQTGRLGSSESPLRPPARFFIASPGFGQPGFREDLYRARELRGDFSFGEQILDIADNMADDWRYNEKTGKLTVNKELVLRSKLRIEARQFHMSRLHPQQWGERQQLDIKNDWALLSEEERRRKADALIQMIRELREPPMQPPPLVYRAEEAPEEPEPVRTLSQIRPAAGPKG